MAATRYPQEFQQQAIELVRLGEQPVSRIAHDLGISDQTLRNWVKQADIDEGRRQGVTTDERQEIVRLRRRNRVLEMEVEILKRAAAFFAREGILPK